MKSNLKIILSLFFAVLIAGSCSKEWLDVNKDPNNPETAIPELVFPAGALSVGAVGGGYYNLLGGFWSQYWAQSNAANQYKDIDQYDIISTLFNSEWREIYANGLSDLQFVIDESRASENWSYYLMGTVMQAYGWQFMVDMHDNIPYFDAFQGDASTPNFDPEYDNGADIYADLIKRIDTALSKPLNELSKAEKKGDMVFNGDTEKWIQFANTLKLKIYMRMMYVNPTIAQAGIEALFVAPNFLNEDAALKFFVDEENQDNPLFASNNRKLNVSTNLRVSATLFRYLEANGDPRLDELISEGTLPMPQGGFNIPTPGDLDVTDVAIFKLQATDPVYFISYVESLLLQAEAVARGWGTGDDKALYDDAVAASFARFGLSDTAAFMIDSVYTYPADSTFEGNIIGTNHYLGKQEAIMMAKWAAFAGSQCMEMFFEINRTHYPRVSTIPSWDVPGKTYNASYVGGRLTYSLEGVTGGLFPKSLVYPQYEVSLNSNFPGQRSVTDKVWWDVKP